MLKYLLCLLIFFSSVYSKPFYWENSDRNRIIEIERTGLQINATFSVSKKSMLKLASGEVYFFYSPEDKKVKRWKKGDPLSIQGYKKCVIYNLRTNEEIKAILQHI